MSSDTENTVDTVFHAILNRIKQAIETSNERGNRFTHERAESYVMSPNCIVSKKATINPKSEKDNECFKWSIIAGLNYNKIKPKRLGRI